MRWAAIAFAGIGGTMKRHKFVSLLLIIQVWFCMTLSGNILSGVQKTEQNIADYNETYVGKTYYSTSECLGDNAYYTYLNDDGQGYKKLHDFATRLLDSTSFIYIMMMEQNIDVKEKPSDIFLCGYEEGDADDASYAYEGDIYHAMKTIQVSGNFLKEFGVSVAEGRSFLDSDFHYSPGETIPVLLGHDYREYLSLGDQLHGIYLGENMVFKVVGFLSDNAYFYSRQQKDMVSCNRYIIMPAMLSPVTDTTSFNRVRLLQQMEGIIVSDQDYQTVAAHYAKAKEEANIEDWAIEVRDPNAKTDQNSVLSTYSAMTDEVAGQFRIILALIIGFVIISMSITISGLIREKKYEYGVRLLCGAPPASIWINAIAQTGVFVLLGNTLALISLFGISIKVVLLLQLLAIVIWAIACIAPILFIIRMRLTDIIGGKE
jgi:hypothetical protein